MRTTKVISVSSGKGGVGKTTMVANLGHLWARRGAKTLLVDGDWNLGKLSITLGVKPQWTLESVLEEKISLERAIQPVGEGLDLLASPSGILGLEELSEAVRNQLFFSFEQLAGRYDVIVFDHSSGVNWGVLQFAAASHQHVVVTTPEPTSFTDAYAIMKILSKRFAIRHFWLLVTMSQEESETAGVTRRFCEVVRSHLGVRISVLGTFPWEPKLHESIRRQRAFVSLEPHAAFTGRLEKVCHTLDHAEEANTTGLRFFYGDSTSTKRDELCQL